MGVNSDDQQMKDLMAQVFPGYEEFRADSVTPSITGKDQVISFLVVCNEEAAKDFRENQEFSVRVLASVNENKAGYKDLNLCFDFAFPVFNLQFFTTVLGENAKQKDFVRALLTVDFFVLWLVDQDKDLLKILKVDWEKDKYEEILAELT
jgi:hypothetical protein